jgi:phosphate starvation-inducible protein PhoH
MARKTRKRNKTQSKLREDVRFLNEVNINNARAMEEGPIKKKWSLHDLKNIKPLTSTQEDMFHAFYNGYDICAHGTAGTGKTFLALYLAFQEILDGRNDANHIIIVRSNVATRDVGHLPGTLDEKMSEYEAPYREICVELFGKPSTYRDMKDAGLISFMPTSFIRGLTWNNAVVIVEEGQNMNFHEIDSVMTRVGYGSRVIYTGDVPQADLPHVGRDKSGMAILLDVMKDLKDFEGIKFNRHDIVRGDFCKRWITATEHLAGAK